jgi:tRNA(fMet)-specific endonuclease VapC
LGDIPIKALPIVLFEMNTGIANAPIRLATQEQKADDLKKLIAAHVMSLGITPVINDLKDFVRYPGVRLEKWRYAICSS